MQLSCWEIEDKCCKSAPNGHPVPRLEIILNVSEFKNQEMVPLTEWRPLLDWLYRRWYPIFDILFPCSSIYSIYFGYSDVKIHDLQVPVLYMPIPHFITFLSHLWHSKPCWVPHDILMTFYDWPKCFLELAGFGVSSSICWRPSLVLYASPPCARESQACSILPIVSAALQVPWYTQVKLSLT